MDLYKGSLALLTDLYQLTMAYGYWKTEMSERPAVFNLFFRRNPFGSGYTMASGLDLVLNYIKDFKFSQSDLAYLDSLNGGDGSKLFEKTFIKYLKDLKITVNISAVEEGRLVFPNEPLIQVMGPILQCQLLETALLNIINFNSLIATKASRICNAANGKPVFEFGLRRAQGIDGGVSASRAAFIGGCSGTSNVLAGKLFDIPVKGTHAHSWVMAHDCELQAFEAYSKVMPHNCILLIDTYDIKQGIANAIKIGDRLKKSGHRLLGVRLDSGNLEEDSDMVRDMLNRNAFDETIIVASDDLDEYKIKKLEESRTAKIDAYGVGTNLVTANDDPALGGVYKLSAIKNKYGEWENKIKFAKNKTTLPGILHLSRHYNCSSGKPEKDVIHFDSYISSGRSLLYKVVGIGESIHIESLAVIKERVEHELVDFGETYTSIEPPKNVYKVEVEREVLKEQGRLIRDIKIRTRRGANKDG